MSSLGPVPHPQAWPLAWSINSLGMRRTWGLAVGGGSEGSDCSSAVHRASTEAPVLGSWDSGANGLVS